MYLLKLALRPWRQAPMSQALSVFAVGFLLLLSGFLFWFQAGLKPVLGRLRGEQVITAYLDAAVEPRDEARLTDTIRESLGAHPDEAGGNGADVRLVRPKEFLSKLREQYPDLSRELEDLDALGPDELQAVVPRYVSATGIFDADALARVRHVPGVESAESSKDRYHHAVGAFQAMRWVARLLLLGTVLALATGLLHLARTNGYLHREALGLLRLWGAGEGVLRAPAMISGLIVGAAGGALAFAGWLTGGVWLADHVRALAPALRLMPQGSPLTFGAALLLAGMICGWVGGAFAGGDAR